MDFFHTHISPMAVELAAQTLRSGMVSEGRRVREFEEELSRQLGLVGPVAVNSGTSALHLGLALAGVGADDEVILPAQTFVACGLAIVMCGARPVFADIQPDTGNLDPASVRARLSARTKVIMPVHWGGDPCDMDEIHAVAQEAGVVVLEDAAHALGATYKGRPIGSISQFTVFSFQAIKHLTTGDGGAVCCRDPDEYEEAKRRRWFGIDRTRDKASVLGERQYNLTSVGYKYHMNDVAAAIGLGNLPELPAQLARRREVAAVYRRELRNVAGLTLLRSDPDRESAWWLFTVLVERRENFVRALAERGVPTSVVHQRIDRNEVFGGLRDDLPQQRMFDDRQIALPIHPGLSHADVDRVIESVKSGW
jgi:perosamine synthetase